VIRELLDECDISVELWNFQVLTVLEIGDSAAKAAYAVQNDPGRAIKENPETRGSNATKNGLVNNMNPKAVHMPCRIKRCAASSPRVIKSSI
jgi:hypothetical protein